MAATRPRVVLLSGDRCQIPPYVALIQENGHRQRVRLELILTGSHSDPNKRCGPKELRQWGFPPIALLKVPKPDGSPRGTMAYMFRLSEQLMKALGGYDAAIVQGDRIESFAAALALNALSIPFVHLYGGDRTGTWDDHWRWCITELADRHVPSSIEAAKALEERVPRERIWPTGDPVMDLVNKVAKEPVLVRKRCLVIQHPVWPSPMKPADQIAQTMLGVNQVFADPYVFSPNWDPGYDAVARTLDRWPTNWHRVVNLNPYEYLRFLHQSAVLVGNTSSGLAEAPSLRVPFVCVGERQKGRVHGANVIFVRHNKAEVAEAIREAMDPEWREAHLDGKNPYDMWGDVSNGSRLLDAIEGWLGV